MVGRPEVGSKERKWEVRSGSGSKGGQYAPPLLLFGFHVQFHFYSVCSREKMGRCLAMPGEGSMIPWELQLKAEPLILLGSTNKGLVYGGRLRTQADQERTQADLERTQVDQVSCLLDLTIVIMPRGHKSKHRSRAKLQQEYVESKSLQGAEAHKEKKVESSLSSSVGDYALPSSHTAYRPQMSQEAPACADVGASCISSDVVQNPNVGANEESSSISQVADPTTSIFKDPLTRKNILVQYMLEKFKIKEPVKQVDMLKVIQKNYKQHFPEIFRNATKQIERIFGIDLQEVKPNSKPGTLGSQLADISEGRLGATGGLSKSGMVMMLLGIIFMKGNRATEKDVWKFLNDLGIHEGMKYTMFGEPRKLITKDLVQDGYLEYRQIRGSDPPCYEFLWGTRARAETTKMQVLEFLVKVIDKPINTFPMLYKEAVRDEERRARERGAAGDRTVAQVSSHAAALI
ncbi:melanoma-associated antigen B4-like [Perognathus longimembris pacificus]|uniref:melanoma-associated antigen B4-like n=1 Tax=Perognathus longimembris pacificus TaxID=214514 RepID=UPI00201925B2|nr:melanoma-associated antigen B4-like [Perognathus longimembris pacificus]